MEIEKLNTADKKLLSYLYHNYREPLTKIAKACRISRDQVEYRIKKYEKQRIIKKYLTIFNYPSLGYNEFIVVWLKIKNNKEIIKKELESMKNVLSAGDCLANYDLFVNFIFKNKEEFEEIFYSFIKKNRQDIEDFYIYPVSYAEFYPLKSLGNSYREINYSLVESKEPINLNKKDIEILKILEKNGRERIIDIAKKTNLSGELALYKIKQLYKKKIILGSKMTIDMEKLGFYFGVLGIKIKNIDKEAKNKIIDFCKNHKYVNALSFGMADYNCLIQIFYQKEEELRKTLIDIKKNLGKQIEKSQLLLIENEGEVKTFVY